MRFPPKSKADKRFQWHDWYAWYPTWLDDGTFVWLEYIQRKLVRSDPYLFWLYR